MGREMSSGATLSFALPRRSVTLNEPIYLELEIRNYSEDELSADLGHNKKSELSFTVESPTGERIQVPKLGSDGLGQLGHVQIEPHGSYRRVYILNEWLRFEQVGEYAIVPALDTAITAADGTHIDRPASAVLTLSVAPRQAKRLSTICESLLRDLDSTSDVEKIAHASLALSHVDDPVAVPYLKRGLQAGTLMWQHAIPGLARIGSPEAIDLLAAIVSQDNAEVGSALAEFHLNALAGKTRPAELD